MMKQIRKKLDKRGFSLAESLVAVLILLMVSAIVAAGMPAARDTYLKTVDAANAETLLSTTATMLRSELSQARYVSGGGDSIEYRSGRTGMTTTLSRPEAGAGVNEPTASMTKGPFLSYDRDGDGTGDEKWYLVTTQATTKRLITDFKDITYSDGVYTVHNLCVTREGTGTIATLETLEIRTVNHD